jgi:hypothetical protein
VVGRAGVGGGGRLLRVRVDPRPGRGGGTLELALAQFQRGDLQVVAVAMAEAGVWPEAEREVLAALDSFTTARRVVPGRAEWTTLGPPLRMAGSGSER